MGAQAAVLETNTQENQRLHLRFKAVVQDGEGRFSRMHFPGRQEMLDSPLTDNPNENHTPSEDWPEELFNGSMNCRITEFPEDFAQIAGEGDRIAALDTTDTFTPEFSIPRELIENNVVRPYSDACNPRKGIAQVWKCVVTNEETGQEFDAWHVRRVDGTYPPFHGIIELMSDKKMRDAYGLENGTPITIDMYSRAP